MGLGGVCGAGPEGPPNITEEPATNNRVFTPYS